MADVGRVLIIPKGDYDSNTEYEMLDVVFYSGSSWIAKKKTKGVSPSDSVKDVWMRLCSTVDSDAWASLEARVTELESKIK